MTGIAPDDPAFPPSDDDDQRDRPVQREDYARSAEDVARQRSIFNNRTIRQRLLPNENDLARRRAIMRSAKWALPLTALVLLGSIAAWPAVERAVIMHRGTMAQMSRVHVKSGSMLNATYRGLDDHGHPFMVTADEARQISPERIDLTTPQADSLLGPGNWVYVTARNGVYIQHSQLLDLTQDVMLYRSDGTTMYSPTADIDMKHGIIVSDSWIHSEGPFGVLDAQGTMLLIRDGIMQFRGPGRMLLNTGHDGQTGAPSPSPAAMSGGKR
ncbi:LPS export ABC transporter periplasmic protein LptC [Novacetimonas cocois]|uniref:LPS export ABC transporter periplasmic protein LptC n=1 Tax=Novacetimonas cocois TaxID=1747507 RepID=UPI001EF082AB|nr:LPS export ABC transporter periplasmic protein LptC [Novacetimonas cocois]